MKRTFLALTVVVVAGWLATPAHGQWLNYPTPGIPRLPNGQPDLSAPAPRTPDGRPDVSGLWKATVNYTRAALERAKIDGVVLQPQAAELYKQRRQNFQRDDPSAKCVPGGVLRQTFGSFLFPFRLVGAPNRVVVLYEMIHAWREVFVDGRAFPKDMNPTWMGYSVGKWEGDFLVIETTGFNDQGWLDNDGLPSSDRLRVIERFRRRDFGHMDLEITVDDPGAYMRPWSLAVPLVFQPDTDLIESACGENNKYFGDRIPR